MEWVISLINGEAVRNAAVAFSYYLGRDQLLIFLTIIILLPFTYREEKRRKMKVAKSAARLGFAPIKKEQFLKDIERQKWMCLNLKGRLAVRVRNVFGGNHDGYQACFFGLRLS